MKRTFDWISRSLLGILLLSSTGYCESPTTEANGPQESSASSDETSTGDDDSAIDPVFKQHVDLHLVRVAIDTNNATMLTDVALQLAEGEKITKRMHRSGVTSKTLMSKATFLAAKQKDTIALERLTSGAKGNAELTQTIEAIKATAGESRAAVPVPSEEADADTHARMEQLNKRISSAAILGDRDALNDIRSAVTEVEGQLSADVVKSLLQLVTETEKSLPDAQDSDDALLKLSGVSRAAGTLLFSGKAEYGWEHRGVSSWGGNWETAAKNDALGKIQKNIASMVNLGQLETFTKKDVSQSISGAYSYPNSAKIAASQSKSGTEATNWVNANNLLINVTNVTIKPGTAFSKTTKNPDFPIGNGARSWFASATMIYTYEIWGKAPAPSSVKYTITNKTKGTITLQFLSTGNTSTLAAGKTTTCNSPIKNGKFPQVKAVASNGKNWLRTISKANGAYDVITTATGIQIVP